MHTQRHWVCAKVKAQRGPSQRRFVKSPRVMLLGDIREAERTATFGTVSATRLAGGGMNVLFRFLTTARAIVPGEGEAYAAEVPSC